VIIVLETTVTELQREYPASLEKKKDVPVKNLEDNVSKENTSKNVEAEKVKEETTENNDKTEKDDLIEFKRARYQLAEEDQSIYQSAKLDYSKLYESKFTAKKDGEEYENSFTTEVPNASEMMSFEEAQETFQNIQYAKIIGNTSEVDYVTRKKFSNWVTFNFVMMRIFEAQSFTRDVNYYEG